MSMWLIGAGVLIILLFPVLFACLQYSLIDRLIAVELGGIISTFIFILIGVDSGQTIYVDVAVIVALLSFGGGIVLARFIERWL